MSGFSVAISVSPFLRQRMGGLSGVAREVILADLAGARKIHIVSDHAAHNDRPVQNGWPIQNDWPMQKDWEASFHTRDRALPEVCLVPRLEAIACDDGERLIVLPGDKLVNRDGIELLRDNPGAADLVETRHYIPATAPRQATWRILQASMKASEGWVGRHINRPISFRMSAFLMRWDISPNWITWFTFGLSIVMAVVLSLGGYAALAIGGALYQAVSVIDCVDGDIARVTYRTSRAGAVLDTACDMLANLGFVAGLIVGTTRTYGMGQINAALAMLAVAVVCMVSMTLLVRLGPRRGSFDVLRAALGRRLEAYPRLGSAVLTAEKMFKRDFYALFAASLCVLGLAWMVPLFGLGGVIIWLMAIIWCAPLIAADKEGDLLPVHLKT